MPVDEAAPEATTARLTEEDKMAIDYGAKMRMKGSAGLDDEKSV